MSAETSETAGIFRCDRDGSTAAPSFDSISIQDIPGFPPKQAPDSFRHWAYGIYLDDWPSGVRIEGNIISDTSPSGILINSGHSNHVVNNIVAGSFEDGIRVELWPGVYELERKGTVGQGFQRNRFERNIVQANDPDQRFYTLKNVSPSDLAQSEHGNVWDQNIVWDMTNDVRVHIIEQNQHTDIIWNE